MFGACFLLVTVALLPAALSVYWVSVAASLAPLLLTVGLAVLLPYGAVRAISRAGRAIPGSPIDRAQPHAVQPVGDGEGRISDRRVYGIGRRILGDRNPEQQ